MSPSGSSHGRNVVRTVLVVAWAGCLLTAPPVFAQTYGTMADASLGVDASLNGDVAFPPDNAWNADVSAMPVDPNSANLIASIGLTTSLHPDFGSGTYRGAIIGIPYVVVSSGQPWVPIKLGAYRKQSDPGPYPVPPDAPIEGYKPNGDRFKGDRHVLVIGKDSNRLFEMYSSYPQPDDSWDAAAGAIFHLDSDDVRPTAKPGWTSADAAGLPIFPGLARYDEASAGLIPHALRFTVAQTRAAYVLPANHFASSQTSPNLPPMGMRVRLKAGYQIPANFSTESKAILQALKTYGMMVADNGSNWFISGAPADGWNNAQLDSELGQVTGADFEVVKMGKVYTK
jgi:hypothetical protein